MKTVQRIGPYVDIIEARSPYDPVLVVRLGLMDDNFNRICTKNFYTPVAQYYGIVQDGLLAAEHIFKGLKRPLMYGNDMEADQNVLIYSWRAKADYVWIGSRFDGKPVVKTPPPRRVFVVLVREEKEANEFQVFGSIEHWSWVEEDRELPQAPVDCKNRYGAKLWSRES